MTSFGQLAANYEGFIVDLWGVVHGVEAFALADLIVESIRAALSKGQSPISLFSLVSIVAVSAEGLDSMHAPALSREVAVALSQGRAHV